MSLIEAPVAIAFESSIIPLERSNRAYPEFPKPRLSAGRNVFIVFSETSKPITPINVPSEETTGLEYEITLSSPSKRRCGAAQYVKDSLECASDFFL